MNGPRLGKNPRYIAVLKDGNWTDTYDRNQLNYYIRRKLVSYVVVVRKH